MNSINGIYHPLLPAMVKYARENGVEWGDKGQHSSETPVQHDLNKLYLTEMQLQELVSGIVSMEKISCPGLQIGESLNWANLGIVGYIIINSPTVLEGLKKFQAYYQMISNITQFRVVARPDTFELCWQPRDHHIREHHRLILEGILGAVGPLLQQQTGKLITPRKIEVCWPLASSHSDYEHTFNVRPSINNSHIKVIYDRSIGELPNLLPNSEMLAVLESHVREQCYRARVDNPRSSEVLAVLKNIRREHIPKIEDVASELGTSIRKLQFQLKKEGVTFNQLRNQALCEEAKLLLRNSPRTIEQISHLLGYSEPAVFYRNFKRWTGRTPREFRCSSLR